MDKPAGRESGLARLWSHLPEGRSRISRSPTSNGPPRCHCHHILQRKRMKKNRKMEKRKEKLKKEMIFLWLCRFKEGSFTTVVTPKGPGSDCEMISSRLSFFSGRKSTTFLYLVRSNSIYNFFSWHLDGGLTNKDSNYDKAITKDKICLVCDLMREASHWFFSFAKARTDTQCSRGASSWPHKTNDTIHWQLHYHK